MISMLITFCRRRFNSLVEVINGAAIVASDPDTAAGLEGG
jgi:hypothetical protein